MKGDPLGGVHAFYSGSFREWWDPLRPGTRVVAPQRARRRARQGQRVRRAGGARVVGRGVRRRPTAGAVRPVPPDDPHRARRRPTSARRTTTIEIEPYTDDELADDRRGASPSSASAGAGPSRDGGRTSRRATRSARSSRARCGSPTWSCWHIGMGMGLYGVKALRLGYEQRQRVPRFFRPDDLNIPDVQQRVHWDPEWARRGRQPRHLRLRPHARDLAHPPLHRLDGRRRVAVEARLPVPQVQLRRRHALDARPRRRASTWPRATGRRSTSTSGARTSGVRSPHPATRRSCCPRASTATVRLPDAARRRHRLPGGARRAGRTRFAAEEAT